MVTGNRTIGQIIHDLLLVESFDVKYYRDLEMWVRGHSRSLKVVPFESLCTVFYSPSIVTMAVSVAILEIFSVKEWPDLEIWVWSPSKSLKMAPFDKPYATFYWSSSSFLACNSRLRSAIRRHHPPQRAVLSQMCCFGERKVVLFQILLDGAEPRDAGTT